MSHTPLPWFGSNQYEDQYGFTQISIGPFAVEGDADHVEETIAYVSGINHDCAANADLILRAVNNHEALLAALKDLEETAMRYGVLRTAEHPNDDLVMDALRDHFESITAARAAIAKADGHLDTHPSSPSQRAR